MFKPCMDCGKTVHHNRAKRCVECANLHKEFLNNKNSDLRLKKTKEKKYLRLKNGLDVLNNVFGQEMFSVGKVWNSERAV